MRKVVLLVCAFAATVSAQIPLPTAPTKYVTDAAGVIPDDREHALNERLAEFERTTSHQVIVYVDRNIPEGTSLEEMAAEAIRTWGVGQAKTDNGAILFLFIDSRDSRIEVGYGLEGVLTDTISKRILVDMRPRLRDGDYAGAIEQGATAILITLLGKAPPQPLAEPPPSSPEPVRNDQTCGSGLAMFLIFIVFAILVLKAIGVGNRDLSSDGWSSDKSTDNDTNSWSASDSSSSYSSSDSSSSYSSSDSSSSSSSSSSSDFSGGGGSGGGGGASDKW